MYGKWRGHLQGVLADREGVNQSLRMLWLQDRNGCHHRLELLRVGRVVELEEPINLLALSGNLGNPGMEGDC